MIGHEVGIDIQGDPEGYTGLECYFMLDSQGKILPCREIEKLKKVMRGKQSWNLQVKMWAEDIGMLLMPEELHEYCKGLPDWIEKATLNQAKRNYIKRDGFCPSFIQRAL